MLDREQLFLIASSDTSLLRTILTAASTAAESPTDDQLRADIAAHGIHPLFDGADLERI